MLTLPKNNIHFYLQHPLPNQNTHLLIHVAWLEYLLHHSFNQLSHFLFKHLLILILNFFH